MKRAILILIAMVGCAVQAGPEASDSSAEISAQEWRATSHPPETASERAMVTRAQLDLDTMIRTTNTVPDSCYLSPDGERASCCYSDGTSQCCCMVFPPFSGVPGSGCGCGYHPITDPGHGVSSDPFTAPTPATDAIAGHAPDTASERAMTDRLRATLDGTGPITNDIPDGCTSDDGIGSGCCHDDGTNRCCCFHTVLGTGCTCQPSPSPGPRTDPGHGFPVDP